MRIPALALVASLSLVAVPASAQVAGGVVTSPQYVVQAPSFTETALESCAGGAAIGFLAAWAFAGPSPGSTAALFCGLSVAATTASAITAWTWHTVTGPFR